MVVLISPIYKVDDFYILLFVRVVLHQVYSQLYIALSVYNYILYIVIIDICRVSFIWGGLPPNCSSPKK